MQLPPLIDLHHAPFVDLHNHPTPISLSRLIADSILVSRSARREFDTVDYVREVCAEGFPVRLGEVMRADVSDRGKVVDQLVGAAVGGVEANKLRLFGLVIWIGDEVGVRIFGHAVFVGYYLLE